MSTRSTRSARSARSANRYLTALAAAAVIITAGSSWAVQPEQTQSLPHHKASAFFRKLARAHKIPNIHVHTVEALRHKFPNLKDKGFRTDSCFALDPQSSQGQRFYRSLNRWARNHDMAVVGLGIVQEYNHAFCFAPVTRDNLRGSVMQMDATDPLLGEFGGGHKTRAKQGTGERMFTKQARALWLVPRAPAIIAGNAKYDVVQQKVREGVNCAEFATGLLHHLKGLGVKEFENFYAAHKAVINATGPKEHRGFAAGLMLAVPHIILQHTSPEWQRDATDPHNGARIERYRDGETMVKSLHTRPIDLPIKYQDFER